MLDTRQELKRQLKIYESQRKRFEDYLDDWIEHSEKERKKQSKNRIKKKTLILYHNFSMLEKQNQEDWYEKILKKMYKESTITSLEYL